MYSLTELFGVVAVVEVVVAASVGASTTVDEHLVGVNDVLRREDSTATVATRVRAEKDNEEGNLAAQRGLLHKMPAPSLSMFVAAVLCLVEGERSEAEEKLRTGGRGK